MTTAIKRYLSEHKIMQKDMAREIGINTATMSKIVRGERMPRIDVVERIEIATLGDVGPRHFYKNPDVWSEVSKLEDAKWAKLDTEKISSDHEELFQELSSWGKLKRLFGG
tara:strand:+ start:260 stop:592 length:333 start_codon:yes stop_codon:yes gene_type:complete